MRRAAFIAALAGCFQRLGRSQRQAVSEIAPQCSACRRSGLLLSQVFVATGPLAIRVLNAGGDDDGSTLAYPVTICSTCGALFASQGLLAPTMKL